VTPRITSCCTPGRIRKKVDSNDRKLVDNEAQLQARKVKKKTSPKLKGEKGRGKSKEIGKAGTPYGMGGDICRK